MHISGEAELSSRKNVQNAHISRQIRELHEALIDIASIMNRPQRDEQMVREAGISLDGVLFALLVGIERRGPIGIVDLADRTGRGYTTISRQVAKLDSLGLVERRQGAVDRRVTEAVVTPKGRAMTNMIDAARERHVRAIFSSWDAQDVNELVHLMCKFAAAVKDAPATEAPEEET